MCFISKFCQGSPALLGTDPYFPESLPAIQPLKEEASLIPSLENICLQSNPVIFQGKGQQLLGSLLAMVNFNSHLLLKLQQVHMPISKNVNSAAGMLEEVNQTLKGSQ